MRALLLILLALVLYIPAQTTFAQEFNAGFVQGLWYSQEKIFVNDSVRIYVAIRNNTGSDLTGTVEFFDGETRIGKKSVQALDGRIIESWADWIPTYGSHTLQANLSRIELSKVGSSTVAVEVTSALAEDIIFVDYDTDKDDVGNQDDNDDDGDTISDTQEKSNGTDPLVKNVIEQKEEPKEKVTTTAKETAAENKTISTPSNDSQNKNQSGDSNTPLEGLEQFLSESPAENVLSSLTTLINNTRQNLDTYRSERKTKQDALLPKPEVAVNADGFGEITRTSEADKNKVQLPKIKIEGESFFDKAFNVVGSIANKGYTIVLTTTSFILSHPMFVQLGILLLILFLMIKFAAKFGRRPKNYR